MKKKINRRGERYGNLTVRLEIGRLTGRQSDLLLCKCKCGQYCEVSEVQLLSREIAACPTCCAKKNPHKKDVQS
jgi:hypothetical protein